MNIGTTANDFGLTIVLLLGLLLVPVLLFGLGALIGKMVGAKAGSFATFFMLLVGIALFYAGSLYMDSAGQQIDGLVVEKNEQIRIRRQGDWRHQFEATVRYTLDGSSPSADPLASNVGSAGLKLNAAQFDTLRDQERTPLRVLPLWRSITVVRLASISTRDLVPVTWISIGVGVLLLGWIILRFGKTRLGCGLLALATIVLGLALPSVVIYRNWLAMEDLSTKPLRAQASVSAVRRITEVDPLPCYNRSCSRGFNSMFDVPQHYDIVQFSFTPEGARDAVIGVDAADAGTFSAIVGDTAQIAYNAADPRAAQLIGATHSHHWKNMVAFAGIMGTPIVVLAVILLLAVWLGRRSKGAFKRARQRNTP